MALNGPFPFVNAEIVRPFKKFVWPGKRASNVTFSFSEALMLLIGTVTGTFCWLIYVTLKSVSERDDGSGTVALGAAERVNVNVWSLSVRFAAFKGVRVSKTGSALVRSSRFGHEPGTTKVWSRAERANGAAERVRNGRAEGIFCCEERMR